MRTKFLSSIISILLIVSCGAQYVQDPNATVLVTSQYEDGPERVVSKSECKSQLDCTGKTEAECAIALYYDSEKFIKEGEVLISKELYASARIELMIALCRLVESEIRLNRAKTSNYQDYKIVMHFKLDKKVKEKIKFCERLIRFAQRI